ncbi:MAG TPA: peptidase [Rubricoccaceae bacterium]|nr:peptidase [Rubricoccaceae bacterium]
MLAHTLFVFLDGVGLGADDPAINPFAVLDLPAFARFAGGARWTVTAPPIRQRGHVFLPIDATLGVEGLPQSGTGQVALFAGVNAAALAGRHFGPYPPSSTRAALAGQSVFARLRAGGVPVERLAFANAFPDRFFQYIERSGRWTTTTLAAHAAGVRLRDEADLRRGDALAADLTGAGWPTRGGTTVITEEEAGRRLARLTQGHTFTLFEHWLTDKAGHAQDFDRAASVLASLDRFFASLLGALDIATDLLVLSSDHGNLEDLSTKGHTRKPVPLVALGVGAEALADVRDLTGVTPALVEAILAGR